MPMIDSDKLKTASDLMMVALEEWKLAGETLKTINESGREGMDAALEKMEVTQNAFHMSAAELAFIVCKEIKQAESAQALEVGGNSPL